MGKDGILQIATQVFQYLAEACSEEGMESADRSIVDQATDIIGLLGNIRIFAIMDDKEVKEYIKLFNLQNPRNMIRFFAEGYVSTIEGCYENLNELKAENLQMVLGEIVSAARTIRMGIDNPDLRDETLSYAQHDLSMASGKLERLLPGYIHKIGEIDNRSQWRFFLRARTSLNDIDTNVSCAKQAVEGLNIAVRLQMLIAVQRNMEIGNSVTTPYLNFMKSTVTGDVCNLLNAYDKDKQEGYWIRISKKIAMTEAVIDVFEKYRDDTQKKINRKRGFLTWLTTIGKKQRNKGMQQ